MERPPCLNCKNRHINCHSDCEIYKGYAERREQFLKAKYEEYQERNDWYLARHERVREVARQNRVSDKRKKT